MLIIPTKRLGHVEEIEISFTQRDPFGLTRECLDVLATWKSGKHPICLLDKKRTTIKALRKSFDSYVESKKSFRISFVWPRTHPEHGVHIACLILILSRHYTPIALEWIKSPLKRQ